jgi:hypothetical protein
MHLNTSTVKLHRGEPTKYLPVLAMKFQNVNVALFLAHFLKIQ